jgi:LPS O-antigen subunit length determinant protein (WzzB/FepE family)
MKSALFSVLMFSISISSFAQSYDGRYSSDPEYRTCVNLNRLINGEDDTVGIVLCDIQALNRANRRRREVEAKEAKRDQEVANQRAKAQREREARLPQICVAGCVNKADAIDENTLVLGSGANLAEASDSANYNTTAKFNCPYVAKVKKCEVLKSKIANNYVEVACLSNTRKFLTSSITSGKGRNSLEAEMVAKANLSKKFKCHYGVGVYKSI